MQENVKFKVLFKVYGQFSRAFQDKFCFQGLFKAALHFQVLFKPVRTLICDLRNVSQYPELVPFVPRFVEEFVDSW